MGATTQAESNQLHKAMAKVPKLCLAVGGRREPDWCLFFLPQPHTNMDSDLAVSKYE